MIPFTREPVLRLGSWHISAFAALMVAGILVGRTILMRRARRFAIPHAEIAPLYLIMLVAGIAGAVLAQGILSYGGFTLEMGGLASIGGLAAGIPAGLAYAAIRRLAWQRTLQMFDIIAFAVPFASSVARLGCVLAHDHRGLPSTGWLAVSFPEGSRWDLGLLDFLFLAGLSLLFLVLDRWPHQPGLFIAVAGVLYGSFRIWRETLDVSRHFAPWAVVVLVGVLSWVISALLPRQRLEFVQSARPVRAEQA